MSQASAAVGSEIELPAPGVWVIDRAHSSVGFVVRHLVVSKVRGRFGDFSGTVQVGETPEASSVEVTIDAASIDTGEPQRDAHLRSPDFLDVENFPTLHFLSTKVEQTDKTSLRLTGGLTIRGVTRPVALNVEYVGLVVDPWGNTKAVLSAATDINREHFGLTWNQVLEAGGVLVGKDVRIEIELQLARG